MVSLSEPGDIETELDAQWNAGVIAEPGYKNEFLGESTQDPNTITYSWDTIEFDNSEGDTVTNDIRNIFEIGIIANTSANALLMLSEVRRITAAKSITDGYWHIDNAIPAKWGNYIAMVCTMVEYLHEVV